MTEKKMGFTACINAIGTELYNNNKERCIFASGYEGDKGLWCFVGLNTSDINYNGLHLSANFDEWEYYASCYVKNNVVIMDKCKLPSNDETTK